MASCLALFVSTAAVTSAAVSFGQRSVVSVEIARDAHHQPKVLSVTEPTYASWNIDSSCNRGFHHINFSNPNLIAAAKGLHPSKLRFGGSGNDNLVYGLSPGSPECEFVRPTDCGYSTPGCLNATHWQSLHDLAHKSESDFIFGVSYGQEQECREGIRYEWNSTNAATLLDYIQLHQQRVWGFELGNEVNNLGPGAACNQTPAQQARAQLKFGQMVKSRLPNARLIGPDTGGRDPQHWLQAYLPLVNGSGLHAITHHVYAGVSRDNFYNASRLDGSLPEIKWYTTMLRQLAPTAQVWAGEDGPTGGGNDGTCGTNSACGTYSTTLWYADDLSLRAKHGFVQYQRQDLIGGYYGLVNTRSSQQSLGPTEPIVIRPDYWVNFLWKRTLGRRVLNASSSSPQLRAYAFEGSPPSSFAAPECIAALQLILISLNRNESVEVNLLPTLPASRAGAKYSAWTLAPTEDGPFSKQAILNGKLLPSIIHEFENASGATFLDQIPVAAIRNRVKNGIVLPPLSTSFVCLPSQSPEAIAI